MSPQNTPDTLRNPPPASSLGSHGQCPSDRGFFLRFVSIFAAAVLASLALASSLPAYIDHLTEEDVVEAYLLGQRHDQNVSKFFRAYEMIFPNVRQSTNVGRIAIRTPYSSVVQTSFERGSAYPMSRAREDYAAKPYQFEAVVTVNTPFAAPWTAADMSDPKSRFWKQFDVELSQDRKIAPLYSSARPLYSTGVDTSSITGSILTIGYDVRDVASRMLRVTVTAPENRSVTAEFDLEKLR